MKTKVLMEVELEVKEVLIDIAPRYIGDSSEDDIPSDFPLLNDAKNNWVARVDIDTGQIQSWPQGDARTMYAKVCDAGTYRLFNAEHEELAAIHGYVPHGVVPGEYGDYIELHISESGVIENWPRSPDVSAFFESEEY